MWLWGATASLERYCSKDKCLVTNGYADNCHPQCPLQDTKELLEALKNYYEYQNAIGKQLYDSAHKVKGVKLQETLELLSQNVYDLENEICVIEKALGGKEWWLKN